MDSAVIERIGDIEDWKQGSDECEWAGIEYTPFQRRRNRWSDEPAQTFRLVVERVPEPQGQGDLFNDGAYEYQAILTSDWQASPEEIFAFYRARGRQERQFYLLKNDFAWNHMPFSQLNQNTVFFMITAMIRNIYEYVISRLSEQVDYLRPSYRLKKFIFRFITVPAKWIHSARQWWLKLYSPKLYPD